MSSETQRPAGLVTLEMDHAIWERFFTAAPLVVIGIRELDGKDDLGAMHAERPMGWANYFGFGWTPHHSTYQNIQRDEGFNASYSEPASVRLPAFSASPCCEDPKNPALDALQSFETAEVNWTGNTEWSLFPEYRLERIIDEFVKNSVIVGRIVAAKTHSDALGREDIDEADTLAASPLLAGISPGRFATIDERIAFSFPAGLQSGEDA